jgi:hypothetical protein
VATVTLYKINQSQAYRIDEQGEGWSLKPYDNGSSPYYDGETLGSAEFDLPDGYELQEDQFGDPIIVVDNKEIAQLVSKGNTPALVTAARGQQFLTRRGSAAQA